MSAKPIHGEAIPFWKRHGYADKPPVPCEFQLGDLVEYTNDYGLKFQREVRGFAPTVPGVLPENTVYIFGDASCWWFPVCPRNLKLIRRGAA